MNDEDVPLEDHGLFCPHCACKDRENVRQNGSGEVQCENCGYSETQ